MDVEALHVALQQSFSPDASLRDPAEELVKNLKYVQGSTAMLLQVAVEKQVQFEVRQAAAIQLKNICKECWAERLTFQGTPIAISSPAPPILSAADKTLVRTGLVECLLAEPEKSIRDILAETLHSIAIHDFPQNWPDLLPHLISVIQSNDPLRVHNALLALRKLCKRFEYKSKEQRGPLNDIVTQSFPLLLPLAQRLSSPEEHSLEAALMLKQILKIFWSSTQFYLPVGGPLSSPAATQPWFDIIHAVVSKPLPEASTGLEPRNQPTDIPERNAWPWWKAKKWAVQIMSRLFSRYGMPGYAEDDVKEFARHFSANVAPQFLGPVCETLNLRPSGQFCTDRVVHLCLAYVDLAVELAPTYKMLKPHLDFLLYKVVFPTLCLTPDDVELFQSDPHEFIHRQSSPLADFYDPRMSAITLLTDLVKHRGKDVTERLLAFLTDCLNRYAAAAEGEKNHIEKDGALLAIGSLAEYLLNKKKYASQLETLLVTHVYYDFNSTVGFLRCRACWMLQKFSKVEWTGENLRTVIQLVLQRLSDECLPVQIEASKALRFLIEVKSAEETLLPVLPQLLTEYFRIMNEIGNDEVVAALQVIIDRFGDHIAPHAVALVAQLSNSFSQYCAVGEEDDDAAMAAAQCLECIATVLKGTCGRPELYTHMEPHLVPLVLRILGSDGEYIEYLEYALDILTFLTYFPATIAANLWEALPLIYLAFDHWAFDYLNMMVPPLENFVGKDPDHFLTATTAEGLKFIDLIFSMVAKTVAEERSSESECRKALSLYMTVLHNCKGKIDTYVTLINDIALAKLGQQVNSDIPLTRIAIFQVLGSSLYYNPLLQIAEFEKRGVTQQVFTQWFSDTERMERWLPQKMTVLGLAAILQVPTNQLPPTVQTLLPTIITQAVKVTLSIKEDEERDFADNFDEDDDDDIDEDATNGDNDSEDGFDENEDVTSQADEAYLDALNKLSGGTEVTQFLAGEAWGDDDDYEDDYSSPLDKVDQLYFLEETLKAAHQREPVVYNQIQTSLGPGVEMCQKMFQAAEKQRVDDAEQAKQLKGGGGVVGAGV